MSDLIVERLGGIAGIGLPGSHIRSRGRLVLEQLAATDRAVVENLFAGGSRATPKKQGADSFRYRLSRSVGQKTESIEVNEADLPSVLTSSVKDELV